MAKTLNAIVTQRIEINPRLINLRVVPEVGELPDFIAGQFVLLGLPWSAPRYSGTGQDSMIPRKPEKLILRSYSVASSSVAREYLEFHVGLVESGLLSPRLFALKTGDRLYLGPQFMGLFTLSEAPTDANVILIATGTGVAPYMSMMRTEAVRGLSRRFAVIHGAHNSFGQGYHEELKTLDAVSPNFDYLPIISNPFEETTPWPGPVGFVQKLWIERAVGKIWGFEPTPENTHVFLCGNPRMIDEMSRILDGEGYTEHTEKHPGNFHVEKFFV
jgi:ferredoxin--NADP+ reductase